MTNEAPRVQLDRDPTPDEEAREFENPDERLQAQKFSHELALLAAKKGFVGRLTGSTNETMNTGVLVLVLTAALLVGTMIGAYFAPQTFGPYVDDIIKIIFAVVGYIFGTHQAAK